MSVHKKIQPNWSSHLACYMQHIYACLILLLYIVLNKKENALFFHISNSVKIIFYHKYVKMKI